MLKLVAGIARQSLHLQAGLNRFRLQEHFSFQEWLLLLESPQAEARQSLHHQADGTIRGTEQAMYQANRSPFVQILRIGCFKVRVS